MSGDFGAGLHQAVAEFRAFLVARPVRNWKRKDNVAGLEVLSATLPGLDMPLVGVLLALMRLPGARSLPHGNRCRRVGQAREPACRHQSTGQPGRGRSAARPGGGFVCRLSGSAHGLIQGAAAGCLLALIGAEVAEVVEAFQQEKRMTALLDFDDLLHGTRDLLTRSEVVRSALGARYRHVLVDEFQDTDPLQGEIFLRPAPRRPAGRGCRLAMDRLAAPRRRVS